MSILERLSDPELLGQMSVGQKVVGALVTAVIGMLVCMVVLAIIMLAIRIMHALMSRKDAPAAEVPAADENALGPNEYIGVGVSEIGGEVKVKVTMDGDKIAKIDVISHKETAGISDPALAKIPEAIIAANSTEVDVVSGATKTSEALIAAVNDALAQIKK